MNASDFSTMYHVNPVVSDLNKVPGFDPLKHMRETKDGLKLDLPYKKLWFRLKYPNGIIRPLLVKITDQLAIIEARVFFDRRDSVPAASFIAQCSKEENEHGDYIKAAQNSAIDQALSDAGFGVQFIPVEPGNDINAGVVATKPSEHRTASIRQEAQSVPENQPAAETKVVEVSPAAKETKLPEEKPIEPTQPVKGAATKIAPKEEVTTKATSALAYTGDMTVEQILPLMSQEEAENYVVKEGTCAGWTLAQVADRRPASLKFYINGYQGKDNILRAAATIMTQKTAA